ncbi:hypothetical protein BCR44DRAFT_250767, partial [Catenaria anguillulae PL171]
MYTLLGAFWITHDQARILRHSWRVILHDLTYKVNRHGFKFAFFNAVDPSLRNRAVAQAIQWGESTEWHGLIMRKYRSVLLRVLGMDTGMDWSDMVFATDYDDAARRACIETFPGCRRIICSWHMSRAIRRAWRVPLGTRWHEFMQSLRHCRLQMTERGFDEAWAAILDSFPSMVDYLDATWFKVREDWARYGIGLQFTAATTATSRSESSHAKLKRDGSSNQSLLEFKVQLDEFLASELRSWNDELVRTKQGRGMSPQEQQETRKVFGGIVAAIEPLVTATWMTMFLNRVRKSFGYQVDPFTSDMLADTFYSWHDQNVLQHMLDSAVALWYISSNVVPRQYGSVVALLHHGGLICSCKHAITNGMPCKHILAAMRIDSRCMFNLRMIHPHWLLNRPADPIRMYRTLNHPAPHVADLPVKYHEELSQHVSSVRTWTHTDGMAGGSSSEPHVAANSNAANSNADAGGGLGYALEQAAHEALEQPTSTSTSTDGVLESGIAPISPSTTIANPSGKKATSGRRGQHERGIGDPEGQGRGQAGGVKKRAVKRGAGDTENSRVQSKKRAKTTEGEQEVLHTTIQQHAPSQTATDPAAVLQQWLAAAAFSAPPPAQVIQQQPGITPGMAPPVPNQLGGFNPLAAHPLPPFNPFLAMMSQQWQLAQPHQPHLPHPFPFPLTPHMPLPGYTGYGAAAPFAAPSSNIRDCPASPAAASPEVVQEGRRRRGQRGQGMEHGWEWGGGV